MVLPKVIFDKYEMQRVLGRGTFGTVYYAKHIETNEIVAIKVMKKVDVEEAEMMDQIKREISLMARAKHPSIVEIKGVMASKSKIYIVMEYLEGGELSRKLCRGRLSEKDALRYFKQLISAVEFCHGRGIYHRDLKLENLLLDGAEENIKVADFGLSATAEQIHGDGLLHTVCGAPAYMAPEVIRRRGYDGAKADIWSCGVILFAFLSGTLPFQDENLQKMYDLIIAAEYEIPPGFPMGARKLVGKMLVRDPKRRISIDAIKRDPWFLRGINRSISTATLSEMGRTNGKSSVSPSTPTGSLTRSASTLPGFYNAFELISSMASGFNLSGLFEDQGSTGSMFTSRSPPEAVMEEIERMAREMRFQVNRLKEFKMKLTSMAAEVEEEKRLEVTVEVFRSAPEVTVVEFSKTAGDTAGFTDFCENQARPALRDIVWTWQGDCDRKSISC